MTGPGDPRRGRHSSADDSTGGYADPRSAGRYGSPSSWDTGTDPGPQSRQPADRPAASAHGRHADYPSPAHRRLAGLLDRMPDATGPLRRDRRGPERVDRRGPERVEWRGPERVEWRHSAPEPGDGDTDAPIETPWPAGAYEPDPGKHPSAPLPPRPPGVWDRLHRRTDDAGHADDDATEAHPMRPMPPSADAPGAHSRHDSGRHDSGRHDSGRHDSGQYGSERDRAHDPEPPPTDEPTDAHRLDWQDHTGGLEVIGAHVDERGSRFRRRGARRGEQTGEPHHDDHDDLQHDEHDEHDELQHDEHDEHDDLHDDGPYRPRRRKRRPVAAVLAVLLLLGAVAGIWFGGQKLLQIVNPTAEDFSGIGTGSIDVRVGAGDTLSDIGRTLVDAGVIASVGPFVDAAEANPAATGIQPGVYDMRAEMSGQAALDRLLDPAARQLSRVTVPEGLTVDDTLQRIADESGIAIEELEAAAADPQALGVPEYAGGQLEGYLFPATYDVEPGTTAGDALRQMVDQFNRVAADIGLDERAAAIGMTPGEVVTVASMIQSETRLDEERPDVAQVVYNRLDQDIPLGIDATLAYGLDKNGNDLTVTDLQTDSPYNTRTRTGLPPTPISAPGQASLEAALAPSQGDLLFYVLESEDGSHFFTDSAAEFEEAVQRCAEAGLGCGG